MFEFFITKPLGFIIQLIYNIVQNYGWSIIIFTIVVKLILLPLQIKSQKGMKKQQKVQPIIAELQKKYANDKEKFQTEMMKVYKENNVSMMGGCLPLLVQFPILIGLYQVIQKPLSYLLQVDFKAEEVISRVADVVSRMAADPAVAHAVETVKNLAPSELANAIAKSYQIPFLTWCRYLEQVSPGSGFADWTLNFSFFGLDISKVPSSALSAIFSGDFTNWGTILLLIIPIVAVFMTWYSMWQTQKMTGTANTSASQDNASTVNSMNKTMNLVMPIMTGVFTFTLPSAMGLYWIASSFMQIVTQYILNVYFDKKGDDFVVKVPGKNRKNGKKSK